MVFIIDESISSELNEIKSFVDDMLVKIRRVIKDQSVFFDVKLILNELIINSCIHGNMEDKNKEIKVYLLINDSYIKVEITDEGCGFYYDRNTYDPTNLKCNGRGLVIADGLSDEFYINKNKVVSIKYL